MSSINNHDFLRYTQILSITTKQDRLHILAIAKFAKLEIKSPTQTTLYSLGVISYTIVESSSTTTSSYSLVCYNKSELNKNAHGSLISCINIPWILHKYLNSVVMIITCIGHVNSVRYVYPNEDCVSPLPPARCCETNTVFYSIHHVALIFSLNTKR